MIANVSAHRRANAFAQALEDQTVQGAAAEQPAESAEPAEQGRLLALASGLGELPKPTLDPEVKMVQRAQLVAAMEAMLLEGTAAGGATPGPTVPEQRKSGRGAHRASRLRRLRPRSRWSKSLAAGGLTVGVAAGAFGGVAAASSDALPGDSLYGLKRGMEDFKLNLADDESDRGGLYLDHASTRLNETRRLMERGRSGRLDHESMAEIRRTLSGMKHDAAEGHRLLHQAYERDGSLGPIATLSSFSASHRQAWNGLRERLPVQLTDVGDEVSSVFDAIDEEVAPLQSLLPRAPEKHAGATRPGSTPDSADSGRPSQPSPSAPSEGGGSGSHASDRPDPSGPGADSASEEGLLGGSTGGLLDPPHSSVTPSPSENQDSSDRPGPDVTIPPLLPDLLPGLGIKAEDAGQ
ncbi:DUF5667 domain-containing protein [Streptomyces scopuliridis]|uniref:DUF5667 domain-containing protein n=1 Tax=Streptomyces scopuliridis TaxID=452529 RepID=A0ACD4ZJK3_9ACTN|nr:DUF5667 domain-containing protein [Streptomyces scopuliridis]WSB34273.1 DUF5667 domain-containing protein [Streptomyces scopuliridis]WSB98543.1 DUF5667 domain-containing protein [Streptomyces scopuliridis]WSC07755.1 DUF5667 domain-containing protein [Streptomyces scopuliridis]